MWQRKDVCRSAKRGALDPRHARLPNLTLRYRAGSAVVHLTTTPRLVPSHPSPRVKSHHGVLVRAPRTSRILQLADLDVSVPATNPRSFRGDLLILPGKPHCFEPPSRLFPPFSAL